MSALSLSIDDEVPTDGIPVLPRLASKVMQNLRDVVIGIFVLGPRTERRQNIDRSIQIISLERRLQVQTAEIANRCRRRSDFASGEVAEMAIAWDVD